MLSGIDLTRLFYLVEHNLNENIKIGFHSHNNMQLAYSNAQSLVDLHSDRELIIDASVYGMGRGAGNLNTELFVQYLNDNADGNYDIKPLASPGYTKLFQKDSLDATFCGGEANVAVSLANFGVQSEFLTVVPDNDVGHASLNALRYFGVDTSKTFFKNGRMGLYYLEKGASQRPSKVIYDRAFSSIALADLY